MIRPVDMHQLRSDVERLATPAGRLVGTPGHRAARQYIVERLARLGLRGYAGQSPEMHYTVDGIEFTNLVARVPGTNPILPPVLLAAHYDTCGALPGADDNAAAVAILLALAAALGEQALERDVLLAFFDAEEPPHFLTPRMGSVHFYHHQRTGPIHAALVLDLVGHDVPLAGLSELLFITGIESDLAMGAILRAASGEGLAIVPTLNRYAGDMSDHHVFRMNQRPYLFLTCGRWEHYHAPTDTPEKLNYGKMAAITALLAELVPSTATIPLEGPFEGYDSTPVELEFMRASLGPMLAALGIGLSSREDIDQVAHLFVGRLHL